MMSGGCWKSTKKDIESNKPRLIGWNAKKEEMQKKKMAAKTGNENGTMREGMSFHQ